MAKIPDFFPKIKWGRGILHFFHEIDICIYQLETQVKVISLSTHEIYCLNIKYTRNFICSVKYKKIFFVTWQNYKHGINLVSLTVEDGVSQKIKLPTMSGEMNLFISSDEDYLIIFTTDGYVHRLQMDTHELDMIINFNDFKRPELSIPPEDDPLDCFFAPPTWYKVGNGIYENYVKGTIAEPKGYIKLNLNLHNKTLKKTSLPTILEKAGYMLSAPPKYCEKSGFWAYIYAKRKPHGAEVLCEFHKDDNYYLSLVIPTRESDFYHVYHSGFIELQENLVLFHYPGGLYLCDLNDKITKYREFPNDHIYDVFIYKPYNYIIPVFFNKVTKEMYLIEDFTKEKEISLNS